MSAFYDLNKTPRNILNQAIVRAIISENNGAWFDPSDLSTLFQDAAGTIPVTALGQPVGRWLDKSGNGNHATQSITASRPTLSARYNQLLNSATLSTQSVSTVVAQYTLSFTGTGSVTLSGTATGTLAGTGTNNRVSLSFTSTAGALTLTVTGAVTLAMLAFGTLTTYQEITTATNYDSVGWGRYVRFDGIDDYLKLPYMGLYDNGAASAVIALSQGGPDNVYERILSETNTGSANQRYLIMRGELNGGGVDSIIINDAITSIIDTSIINNPINTPSVISFVDSGTNIRLYRNYYNSLSQNYTRIGTVTLNNTMIGAQQTQTGVNGFSLMSVYGLCITKSALSDSERRQIERLLAYNSGVQI